MAILPRNLLRSFFERGDKPTAAQFSSLIDSMLHSSEDAARLGLRVFSAARTYQAGESVIYNDDIYQALVSTTGAFDITHWKKVCTSGGIPTYTWLQLNDLKELNGLTKGQQYLIEDFTSPTQVVVSNSKEAPISTATYIHPVDPMIVTALSDDTICDVAYCPGFPQDIIYYNFEENRITYRKDTLRNLSAHYDWRHWTFQRWETEPYKGDFLLTKQPFGEITYIQGTVVEKAPGNNQLMIEGNVEAAAASGVITLRHVIPGGEAWVFTDVTVNDYSLNITIDESGNPVYTTYIIYNSSAYPQLTPGLEIGLKWGIRSKNFYTFGNSLRVTNAEVPAWIMTPALDGNAGEDCINIELGPVSEYWWDKYANGHIFDKYCYNIKIGAESVNVTVLQNVWDVEMGSDIYGGLLMGNNTRIYVKGNTSVYIGRNTASVNVLGAGPLYEFIEESYSADISYKAAIGKNCNNITLVNCSKPGTADLPGVPDSTIGKVYFDMHAGIPEKNGDTALAEGTSDEVTAAELRSFLDGGGSGGTPLVLGHILFVDASGGDDATGERGKMQRPYATLEGANTAAQEGDTIWVFPGNYTTAGGLGVNGVNWHFCNGAYVTSVNAVFQCTEASFNITGSGEFEAGPNIFVLTNCTVNATYHKAKVTDGPNGCTIAYCMGGYYRFIQQEFESAFSGFCLDCSGSTLGSDTMYIEAIRGKWNYGGYVSVAGSSDLPAVTVRVENNIMGSVAFDGNYSYVTMNAGGIIDIKGNFERASDAVYKTGAWHQAQPGAIEGSRTKVEGDHTGYCRYGLRNLTTNSFTFEGSGLLTSNDPDNETGCPVYWNGGNGTFKWNGVIENKAEGYGINVATGAPLLVFGHTIIRQASATYNSIESVEAIDCKAYTLFTNQPLSSQVTNIIPSTITTHPDV